MISLFIFQVASEILLDREAHQKLDVITNHVNPNKPLTLTIIIAMLALIASAIAAYYAHRTAFNVGRVARKTQMMLFEDLVRHLYRNKICTLAIAEKMKKEPGKYPSEIHILKLKTLPEDIHLERYNKNPKYYAKMHELGLLLRNYNTEIDVAQWHLSDANFPEKAKNKDFSNLLFKPFYIIVRILDVMDMINKKDNRHDIIRIILSEHFNKLHENYNRSDAYGDDGVLIHKDQINTSLQVITDNNMYSLIEDKGKVTIMSKSVFNAKNRFFTEKFRRIISDHSIPKELAELICDETGGTPYLFDITLNATELLPKVLRTDVAIEYTKIQMIEFPNEIKA